VTYQPTRLLQRGRERRISRPIRARRARQRTPGKPCPKMVTGFKAEQPATCSAAFYYTTVAGEYCTDKTLRTCVAASEASPMHPLAAPLRWCNSEQEAFAALLRPNACRATQTDAEYKFPRMPEPHTSTLTINAGGSVTGITVAGSQILSSPSVQTGRAAWPATHRNGDRGLQPPPHWNCQVVGLRGGGGQQCSHDHRPGRPR
jgi:hypothetical protein